jgi:hypothetical protein
VAKVFHLFQISRLGEPQIFCKPQASLACRVGNESIKTKKRINTKILVRYSIVPSMSLESAQHNGTEKGSRIQASVYGQKKQNDHILPVNVPS